MKIAFVSSMNMDLYKWYGKRFLEEFAKFRSEDISLYNVFEGNLKAAAQKHNWEKEEKRLIDFIKSI